MATASIASLKGQSLSRKDDIESLAYTFMYMIDPAKVPWKDRHLIKMNAKEKKKFTNRLVVEPKFCEVQ